MEYTCECGHTFEYEEKDIKSHYLMCGDSTKVEDVEKLMNGQKADMVFTDPPYGVGYDGGAKKRDNLENDENTTIYNSLSNTVGVCSATSALYIWCSPNKQPEVIGLLKSIGIDVRSFIVWVKNNATFSNFSMQYHAKYESLLYCFISGNSPEWYGENNEVTVWEANRAVKNEYHPTQKPVELSSRAIKNSSKKDDIVLDLFGGSGSTLIACEQLDRTCFMMEISEAYCDVIRKRYARLINQEEIWQDLTSAIIKP